MGYEYKYKKFLNRKLMLIYFKADFKTLFIQNPTKMNPSSYHSTNEKNYILELSNSQK